MMSLMTAMEYTSLRGRGRGSRSWPRDLGARAPGKTTRQAPGHWRKSLGRYAGWSARNAPSRLVPSPSRRAPKARFRMVVAGPQLAWLDVSRTPGRGPGRTEHTLSLRTCHFTTLPLHFCPLNKLSPRPLCPSTVQRRFALAGAVRGLAKD